MKTIVAVIVYDRFDNLKEWVRCWAKCDQTDAQLIIIHNYENEDAKEAYRSFCEKAGIYYVPRQNIGFDIGAFQDVCRGRLEGFPNEWSEILWCTDDAIPMDKQFVKKFRDPLFQPGVGLTCMEISREIKTHVRTTGFCISQQTASHIQFPADPMQSKWQCYEFEHKSNNILLEQIQRMGLKALQICPIDQSPLWDTGQRKRRDRSKEHYQKFPHKPGVTQKVTIICPVYNQYPEILSSMICQTHENWELLLIHDGPSNINMKEIVDAAHDKRIKYIETAERVGGYGHKIRQWALTQIKAGNLSEAPDYIVITNGDNHHTPNFLERLLEGFDSDQVVGTFCSEMIHSYIQHKIIKCELKQGYLDCAGVMIRADVALKVGWKDVNSHSADWYYFDDIIKQFGEHNFRKVEGCLLVHN